MCTESDVEKETEIEKQLKGGERMKRFCLRTVKRHVLDKAHVNSSVTRKFSKISDLSVVDVLHHDNIELRTKRHSC